MKTGLSIVELAQKIQDQQNATKDYIVPSKGIEVIPAENHRGDWPINLRFGDYEATPNNIFAGQLGNFTGIPKIYLDRMLEAGESDLLATNLNHWLHRDERSRMIRTLTNGHTVGRAFMSDKYRPLDNAQLAEHVLPVLMGTAGLRVESCELTERRLYIKAVNERVEGEVKVGDAVQTGIVISNSEVGCGSLSVTPLLYRLVCSNGMISNSLANRTSHVGGRNKGNDDFEYEADTQQAINEATWRELRDTVAHFLSETMLNTQLNKVKEAEGVVIETPANKLDKVVEVTGKLIGTTKTQNESILQHLIEGGDFSKWGLVNAVTRASQDVADYDDATELEAMGGKILDFNKTQWNQVSHAGV